MASKESIRAFQLSHPKEYLNLERYCGNCYLTRLLHTNNNENYECPQEAQYFHNRHSSPSEYYYNNNHSQIVIKKHFIHRELVSILIKCQLERINEKANINTRKKKV